tara:strand:+ start:901 stop:1335 length:435 start_codon:yes stop_codon:yes gene_type:complete
MRVYVVVKNWDCDDMMSDVFAVSFSDSNGDGYQNVSMSIVDSFWKKNKPDWGKYTTIVCLAKELCSRIPDDSNVVILSQDCVANQEVKWLDGIHASEPNAVEFGSSGIKSIPRAQRVPMKSYINAQQVFEHMLQSTARNAMLQA